MLGIWGVFVHAFSPVAFELFDVNADKYIDEDDLRNVLSLMVGDRLDDEQLDQVVANTLEEVDMDRDGKISFDEFIKVVATTDIESRMTIRF